MAEIGFKDGFISLPNQPAHNADPAACDAMTAATITDGSGGAASQTLSAITGGGADCEDATKNAIASLCDEVNKLIADVAALKVAVDANNAAIDALNADDATLKFTADS
jgi:hypothetical protein